MRRLLTFDFGPMMYHTGLTYANPNVLTAGSPERVDRIRKFLNGSERVESPRGVVSVHGSYKGLDVTAFTTQMGPSSVAINLPELIESCDNDRMTIIRLGTSGGLQQNQRVGDYVVTTLAEQGESVSEKIMGPGYVAEANRTVVTALIDVAKSHALSFQSVYAGPTRTTDELYLDNARLRKEFFERKAKGLPPQDFLAVSMEASVHFAWRDWYNQNDTPKRDIIAGEILVVSDIVVHEGERDDMTEFHKNKEKLEETHLLIGLEALVALAR